MKSSSPFFHPLFLLSFLPSVVYASPAQPPAPLPPPTPPTVNPQPPIAPTPAVHDRALSAPSITTIISTTTESSVGIIQWINPRRVTYFTTKTVTTLRPVLSTATSFPTTITETAISTVAYSDETTYLYNPPPGNPATAMAETGTKSSFAVTVPSVWVVHTPSPSLLGVGEEVPCGEGYFTGTAETEQEREKGAVEDGESRMRDESEPEDERCKAKGMRTGCQGQQCIWEEDMLGGTWWCYLMSAEREYVDPTKRMGRACWGNPGLRYMQLGTPCSIGDMDVGCVRGRGRDVGWGAVYWEGD